jgi:CRISPR-associated protein Cas1
VKTHLNTLFITLEGTYLHQDGQTVTVKHEGAVKLRVPLHNLEGIVTLAWDTTISAALMHACAQAGVALSFCNPHGKFLAASSGPQSGNVLLRKAQYVAAEDPARSLAIARCSIAAKIANTRHLVLRRRRDTPGDFAGRTVLDHALRLFDARLRALETCESLDALRGIEGDASHVWFSTLPQMLGPTALAKKFQGRQRRPPTDPVNALLSFLYSLLAHDCRSACEAVGLDPQMGFLHQLRPGRPSLALDLMEEFRPLFADRLALAMLNRQQLNERDFQTEESGAVLLREDSRKKVLVAWQERKQEVVTHPLLEEKVSFGLLPHLQARLLARHLRGDLDLYPAYITR